MDVIKKISGLFKFGNVLYYPGCLSKFVLTDIAANYKRILDLFEIDYIEIPEFYCCGSPVLNAGYANDFYKLVEKNTQAFSKYSVRKIITSCPSCFTMFKKYYEVDVEPIVVTIRKNIDKLKINFEGEQITYHDPCHLGRKSGIYETPREILEHMGFEVVEAEENREKAMCCGAGGGLRNNAPNLSNKIAKLRLNQVKTKKLVTTCAMCYKHLKDNAKGIEVYELSQLIVEGISKSGHKERKDNQAQEAR